MSLPPALQAVVDFVRRGYPQGVPERDYLPLFALLRRRLSEEEVEELAAVLAEDPAASENPAAISTAIEQLISETPLDADIERVREQLATVGWVSDPI
jgi:hypothetical protein